MHLRRNLKSFCRPLIPLRHPSKHLSRPLMSPHCSLTPLHQHLPRFRRPLTPLHRPLMHYHLTPARHPLTHSSLSPSRART